MSCSACSAGRSRRIDAHGRLVRCKDAEVALDTDLAGNREAFNPAELLHYDVKQYGTVFSTVAPGWCSVACCGAGRRRSEQRSIDPRQRTHSANAQTGIKRRRTGYGVQDRGGA